MMTSSRKLRKLSRRPSWPKAVRDVMLKRLGILIGVAGVSPAGGLNSDLAPLNVPGWVDPPGMEKSGLLPPRVWQVSQLIPMSRASPPRSLGEPNISSPKADFEERTPFCSSDRKVREMTSGSMSPKVEPAGRVDRAGAAAEGALGSERRKSATTVVTALPIFPMDFRCLFKELSPDADLYCTVPVLMASASLAY